MVLALMVLLLSGEPLPFRHIAVAPAETLAVSISGSGTPVVLINGLVGGAYGFRQLVPPLLERGYQTVAIEPLGLGHSSRPGSADYSLMAQADRIARVLDTLHIQHALVLGHSLGSALAYRLAWRRPDLVRGVLSIDGGPAESAAPPGLRRAMRWAPLLKLFVGAGTLRREVRKEILKNSADSTWLTAEVLEGYTAPAAVSIGATINALRGMTRSREPETLRDHLGGICVPVRLLVGGVPHQSGIDGAEIAELQSELPDFAVDTVAGVGQLIHEERPAAVIETLVALDQAERQQPPDPATRRPECRR